jgi:hypothetical protein
MVPTKPNGVHDAALRWNRLKRRAAALGVDVQTLIRVDAAAQRELLKEADDDARSEEEILSIAVTRKDDVFIC